MSLLTKEELRVKKSSLPDSGKGLFTRVFIPKGTRIVEYTGTVTTWKEVEDDADNGYIYFYNSKHVIDAAPHKDALARYANDAAGLSRVKGISNNSVYEKSKGRVYIKAEKDIPAGAEILVSYGKDYWDQVRKNIKIEARKKRKSS